MEHEQIRARHPAALPPGARVGPWRVEAFRGQGTHGAVYRAVREGQEALGCVALKLALSVEDPRFEREVELLSRLRHPSVPRLVEHGQWRDTAPAMIPGTPAYRSPEAWLSLLRFRQTGARYVAGPADDVFALGVTAYRLVTGRYPPSIEPQEDGSGQWYVRDVAPPSPREVNPRVDEQLAACIQRMLSVKPEARGTARELAEALEHAAEQAGPKADQPLFVPKIQHPLTWRAEDIAIAEVLGHRQRPELLGNASRLRAVRRLRRVEGREVRGLKAHPPLAPTGRTSTQAQDLPWGSLFAAVVVVLLPFMCGRWSMHPPVEEMPVLAEAVPDAGVAVGDTTLTTPGMPSRAPSGAQVLALEVPREPLPGQFKPDAKGQCPIRSLVAINGGCWTRQDVASADCAAVGGYVHKEKCYVPSFPGGRQPTSTPQTVDDGQPLRALP